MAHIHSSETTTISSLMLEYKPIIIKMIILFTLNFFGLNYFTFFKEISPETLGPLPDPVSDDQINATSSTKLNNNLGGSRRF